MDTTDPYAYFNSFEIEIASQSEFTNGIDELDGTHSRISEIRQRLMQMGKVMENLENLEKEMQHSKLNYTL